MKRSVALTHYSLAGESRGTSIRLGNHPGRICESLRRVYWQVVVEPLDWLLNFFALGTLAVVGWGSFYLFGVSYIDVSYLVNVLTY